MARGLDKENAPNTPPRRDPFRQKIASKRDFDQLLQEEKREALARGEAVGQGGSRLFYLDETRVVYARQNSQGYQCFELLDERGREIFYEANGGLDSGDRPTIVKEREEEDGSEKIEVWIKKLGNSYQVEQRHERRNREGNLHSPDRDIPALITTRRKYSSVIKEASYFDNGVLTRKIVYKYSFDEVGAGDILEIFDGEGRLHGFDGFPARFLPDDGHELYEHGKRLGSSWREYRLHEIGKYFFPFNEIEEARDYIERGRRGSVVDTPPEGQEGDGGEVFHITPDDVARRRIEISRAR